MFDQVIDAHNGNKGQNEFILPNLIYDLLVMQGFEKSESEFYEAEPTLTTDYLLAHTLMTFMCQMMMLAPHRLLTPQASLLFS